jgi:hypothetical protein
MKIAIVLHRGTGQLDITWPNDEQHTYFASAQTSSDPKDSGYDMVEHEIRDAVADTMQDLLKRGLIRIAGYAVPDDRPAEFAMRIKQGQIVAQLDTQYAAFDHSDPYDVRKKVIEAAAKFLARGESVTIRCGDWEEKFRPNEFNRGPVMSQLGAGELQLRPTAEVIPVAIHHLPPHVDGDAWEVTYSDGHSQIVRDACQARVLAERVFNRN